MMLRSAIILCAVFSSAFSLAQTVNSEEYRKQLNEEYTSGLFSTDNAYMLVPDDDPASVSYWNVFQYLQGRVPGLNIRNAYSFGSTRVAYRGGRPAFFLDEMRVDQSVINNINVSDIALVKIFRAPFMGAIGGGPNGAIAVYTKRGDEE